MLIKKYFVFILANMIFINYSLSTEVTMIYEIMILGLFFIDIILFTKWYSENKRNQNIWKQLDKEKDGYDDI